MDLPSRGKPPHRSWCWQCFSHAVSLPPNKLQPVRDTHDPICPHTRHRFEYLIARSGFLSTWNLGRYDYCVLVATMDPSQSSNWGLKALESNMFVQLSIYTCRVLTSTSPPFFILIDGAPSPLQDDNRCGSPPLHLSGSAREDQTLGTARTSSTSKMKTPIIPRQRLP